MSTPSGTHIECLTEPAMPAEKHTIASVVTASATIAQRNLLPQEIGIFRIRAGGGVVN
jgi:hypothetical protein